MDPAGKMRRAGQFPWRSYPAILFIQATEVRAARREADSYFFGREMVMLR